MRNAGTQLRPTSAALIPPKGVLLGAIDPAIHAVGIDTQKETQQNAGQITRFVLPAARAAVESSEDI